MELVIINGSETRKLPFYLAVEEYLAKEFPSMDFFFMWQVSPTVIVGRHQLIDKEVDVEYCNKHGIEIVRRKSGGGAVVADMNNIMFSYITSSDDVRTTFSEYTSRIAASLQLLGLDASDNSRNDILIGDRKVSGNSFYHLPGRSIVHGTMLYDYDIDRMTNALNPSNDKLASHGVQSIRSRVVSIRESIPGITIDDFKRHIVDTVVDGGIFYLSDSDIKAIKEIESQYYTSEWISRKNPKGSVKASKRIDGVGEVAIAIEINHGLISGITVTGDFLDPTDADIRLNDLLAGKPYDRDVISTLLQSDTCGEIIPGLSSQELVNLII